jgi:hypothetical protein
VRRQRSIRAAAAIVAAALILALALVFGPAVQLRAFPTADQLELERVFRGAMEAEQRTQARVASVDGHAFTAADLERQRVLDRQTLAAYIAAGPLLQKDLQIADLVHRNQLTTDRRVGQPWVDAGIDSITFAEVDPGTVNGSLKADVEVWFNDHGYGRPPGTSRGGSPGHNGLRFRDKLFRGPSGRWLVGSYDSVFIPGEGP